MEKELRWPVVLAEPEPGSASPCSFQQCRQLWQERLGPRAETQIIVHSQLWDGYPRAGLGSR